MKYKTILFCLCAVAQWNGQAARGLPDADQLLNGSLRSDVEGTALHADSSTEKLKQVASGNGLRVAVTQGGKLLHSVDGEWQPRNIGTKGTLHGVAFGAGVFIAVGSYGGIWRSTDGVEWSSVGGDQGSCFRAITFGKNHFVGVGSEGSIVTSHDGIQWERRETGFSGTLQDVAFGAGRFVAAGDRGRILHSRDGIKWDRAVIPERTYFKSVKYSAGGFVALGPKSVRLRSEYGEHWQPMEVKQASREGLEREKSADC